MYYKFCPDGPQSTTEIVFYLRYSLSLKHSPSFLVVVVVVGVCGCVCVCVRALADPRCL